MPDQLDELLAQSEVRFHEAERRLQVAEAEYRESATEREAVRKAVAKLRGVPLPVAMALTPWEKMTRPSAILTALAESDEPLSPREIAEMLRGHGRSKETAALVSNTLNKLKDRGEVVSPSRGVWTIKQQLRPVTMLPLEDAQ